MNYIVATIEAYTLPFVIGTAFHFFGGWVGWPALFVGGLAWVGAIAVLADKIKKEKEQQ